MSKTKECKPNHCVGLKQSAESILRLELKLKKALEHIKEKELQECDYIVKINKFEKQYEDLLKEIEGIVDWHDVGKLKTKLFGG